MPATTSLKHFPALQGRIGDWYYYVTVLSFEEVARRVQPATKLVFTRDLNSWIQRTLVPRRACQIAEYLINQEQRFFPTIVVGVYLGEPTWYPIQVEDNAILSAPNLSFGKNDTLGILELDGTEQLYAIDGQHRVAGIKEALQFLSKNDPERHKTLANETLSIAFVAAEMDEVGGRERVRRLFTTLNKQAKRVSEPEIVALDEDDPAAIITRWITIRYDGLRFVAPDQKDSDHSLIQLGTRHEILPSNRRSVTTIVTLYRMIKRVFQQELQEIARENKFNRPDERILDDLYEEAVEIWQLLRRHDDALNDVLGSDPSREVAGKYRTRDGGHILFRPIGLQAFAGALGVLRRRGVENERAIRGLCQLPMEIAEVPWKHVVWNPSTRRMIAATSNKTAAEALFLHMVGHGPRKVGYPLESRYREMLGGPPENALQEVPVCELE